ncbi:MAG: hypothetical protein V3G42_16630 [Oscillospiraceae bacterium]
MTLDQLAKIQWLDRAFHAEKNYKAWLTKLERDRSIAERLTRSIDGTGSPSGNSTEATLIRLAETERRTQERSQELVRIREEITAVIEAVPDLDAQSILIRHYLAYETFEQIAEEMHYSIRAIKYKHKSALDKVCIDLHPET